MDRPTVYHEAGHAVVAILRGIPFRRVSVVPDKSKKRAGGIEWDGIKRWAVLGLRYGYDEADRALVATYAGALSEARAMGQSLDEIWLSAGSSSDREFVHELATDYIKWHSLTIEQLEGHFRSLRAEAAQLLTAYSIAVERVADELMIRRELTHSEVEALVRADE